MVFSDRKFIVVANNGENYEKHEALTQLIRSNGGEIVPWDVRADGDVSPKLVIVASSMDYERADEMKRFMIPTVTEDWVHACVGQQKLVPMRPYSPDPRNFMRDVIACFSQLSKGDSDVFKAGVLASGGDCSDIVTRYTSHVVATTLDTPECQLVLQSKENNPELSIRLVKPEWMDACMSLGVKVDDTPYLLDGSGAQPGVKDASDNVPLSTQSRNLTGTFFLEDSPRLAVQQSMRDALGSSILDGRNFFFGNDLDLSERVDKTVTYLVETNGGKITKNLNDAQVYIGKWREGDEYIEASKRRLIVGNITWIYWLMIHQKFEKPTHLLHYPEVKGGLATMKDMKICITNYTGDARAYLQSLILSIGASYSGKLIEKNTTHLIAAYESGQKYEAAKKWGIPVVNHLWLEDCYAHWQVKDTESRLYTYFPPKLSMSTLVGARNLVASVLHKFQKPEDLAVIREHHKRQAKQKAGDWLHDAMIIENEYHEKLRRGKLPLPEEIDNSVAEAHKAANHSKASTESKRTPSSSRQHSPDADDDDKSNGDAKRRRVSEEPATNDTHGQNDAHESNGAHENNEDSDMSRSASPPSESSLKKASQAKATQTKASQAKTSQAKPLRRIMISGMDDPPSAKTLSKIGLSLVKTTPVNILVAPRFLKTSKVLQALADTEEFVQPSWILDCLYSGVLLPTDSYRLKDEQLAAALDRRTRLGGRGLFEDRSFRLDHEIRDKMPTFRDLVKTHKGKVVTKSDPDVITIGDKPDQIPWTAFIDTIQHMNMELLKSEP